MTLTVTGNIVAECLRTDFKILGDNKTNNTDILKESFVLCTNGNHYYYNLRKIRAQLLLFTSFLTDSSSTPYFSFFLSLGLV